MNRIFLSFCGIVLTLSCNAQFGNAVTSKNSTSSTELSILDVIKGVDIFNLSIFSYLGIVVILIFLYRSIFMDAKEYSVALFVLAIISGVEYSHTKDILIQQTEKHRIESNKAKARAESDYNNQLKKARQCHFEIAYQTAIEFIHNKSLKLIRQSNNTDENSKNCSVRYSFYVKKMKFNPEQQEWIFSDKVFLLSITLRKYDEDLFGIDVADLIDESKMTKLDLLNF